MSRISKHYLSLLVWAVAFILLAGACAQAADQLTPESEVAEVEATQVPTETPLPPTETPTGTPTAECLSDLELESLLE